MKLIDADVLLSRMDERYNQKNGIVPDTLSEGFMQMDKLIHEQDTFDLEAHDKEVIKNFINKLAEELYSKHADDNSWCEYTADSMIDEMASVAEKLMI